MHDVRTQEIAIEQRGVDVSTNGWMRSEGLVFSRLDFDDGEMCPPRSEAVAGRLAGGGRRPVLPRHRPGATVPTEQHHRAGGRRNRLGGGDRHRPAHAHQLEARPPASLRIGCQSVEVRAGVRTQHSNTDQQMSFRNLWSSSTRSRIASGS
jgi:hypothetical protein